MKNEIWEQFWGGENDLAQDLEDFYEQKFNKSAVYWERFYNKGVHDTLEDRPNEYVTCGYTSDFEGWGQNICKEACLNGCKSDDEVYNYVLNS